MVRASIIDAKESAFNILRQPDDMTVWMSATDGTTTGAIVYDVSGYTISATYEKTRSYNIDGVIMSGTLTITDEGTLEGNTLTITRHETGTLRRSTLRAEVDISCNIVAVSKLYLKPG